MTTFIQTQPIPAQPNPKKEELSLPRRYGKMLLGTPTNVFITVGCVVILWLVVPPLFRWLFSEAVWAGTPEECRQAAGACWPFIQEKFRFFIYGMYPLDERWRATLAIVILFGITGIAMVPRFWGKGLVLTWLAAIVGVFWLLLGGFGLPPVRTEMIGGLPLTLLLSLTVLPLGFPVGLLLALGRRSEFRLFRWISIAIIEAFRGSPLVATLFIASVMLPFFLPEGMTLPKLMRALAAFLIVAAAYIAEALRGGFQVVPEGQAEAAFSIGMKRWQILFLITLPQVIRHSIPGLVTIVVLFFKDTSLIIVIGMSDFLAAIQLASRDPAWIGFTVEGYVFAAAFYFTFCYVLSLYALRLERRRQNH
ncbi:general L-amino acid transport system permease protein [Rhodobium orientis]|uniref:ABC transmembrane type-1 domain-containing protein n=1 Tax=Rhodobium orientis TaxID=34017 RepID=A0A327JX36_9HYPH|nr:amino acid ABC transporter permease [Rhodobium orientis]MBB4301060.1 general L-amino acid transport system permease protein [Rhodobium orientis]MBK5949728.1 hypothetical protein [Rhodobium orientis]RAI30156.1 hypothetical protein CH339_01105 [Rhodobium orientis]